MNLQEITAEIERLTKLKNEANIFIVRFRKYEILIKGTF